MRRFFIVLMIALLPLRSWAGDVMTVEMAVGQLAGVVQTASKTTSDCHGQNSTASNADSVDDSATDARCDTCGTCQLCHSVALADFSFSDLASLTTPSLLFSDSTGFASAPRALSLKPPIS